MKLDTGNNHFFIHYYYTMNCLGADYYSDGKCWTDDVSLIKVAIS